MQVPMTHDLMDESYLSEQLRVKLQGCVDGHLTRQQVVHSVRKEYERVVNEVEAIEHKQLLPLANQVVVWPKKNTLCLPRFASQHEQDMSTIPQSEGAATNTLNDTPASEGHSPLHIEQSLPDATLEDTTDQANTLTHTLSSQLEQDETHTSTADVFPELPKSKEGLIELRAQLSMELLWLKQAIVSRQNYLMYKDQLSPNTM